VAASPRGLVAFAVNGAPRVADGADAGTDNVPGARVRAQTRDVVALLQLAAELYGGGGGGGGDGAGDGGGNGGGGAPWHYMFLEDDFRVCPRGLEALAYALHRASALHAAPQWNALRVSYGLNGGVLRGRDVPALAGYLLAGAARRPPDHLWVEWFAGETAASAATKRGRPHAAFRYNLLEHFGRASSLRGKEAPLYALCYDELDAGVVFEVEAFKRAECPRDLVWPCPAAAGAPPPAAPGIDFAALALAAGRDSVQGWALGERKGGGGGAA